MNMHFLSRIATGVALVVLAVPAFSYAGNLWGWIPQVRIEHRFNLSEGQSITVQGGIMDNVTGELPSSFDAAPHYRVEVEDPMWAWIYLRIAAATEAVSRVVGRLQRGRIAIYLLYSFITLVTLLFLTQA